MALTKEQVLGLMTLDDGGGAMPHSTSSALATAYEVMAMPYLIDDDTVPPVPVASFTYTPHSGLAPLSVAFTGAGTNTPTSWHWDFDDGNTSTSQSPTHEFSDPGTYHVSLIATNATGDSVAVTHNVVVSDPSAPHTVRHFGGSRLRAPRQRTRG